MNLDIKYNLGKVYFVRGIFQHLAQRAVNLRIQNWRYKARIRTLSLRGLSTSVYFIIFTKYVADPGWCRLNLPDMSLYLYIEWPTECSIIVN